MAALAQSVGRRARAETNLALDAVLVILGSLLMGLVAQLSIKLPFTPVPVTGQTLGVLVIGGALGSVRGALSMLLYLVWGAVGLPFFAEGRSGIELLAFSSATGGYLWGFVVAGYVVGLLAERKWDRGIGSSLGAMFVGEVIIFTFGVTWLSQALGLPLQDALEAGLYPFVVGDVIKLAIAAGVLPAAWRALARAGDDTRR
ncbi:MAG: biotin transporter BioY [Actinomycetota bacterium]|nr:biotin transporter BioY [Actinomycetota bacterium]